MQMIDHVIEILRNTLQLEERADEFDAETPLLGNIPEFDSMAVVTVLAMMEDEFGIEIDDDEITAEVFETVGSLTRFIANKVED